MKKIVILLAVVALAAPAFAQVGDVELKLSTRVEAGPRIFVDVRYDATDPELSALVCGFSFEVAVDNGAAILDVVDYKGYNDFEDVYSSSAPGKTKGFGIYPSQVEISIKDPLDPCIFWEGTPVVKAGKASYIGTPGPATPEIAAELAALYERSETADAPETEGFLFSIEVDKLVTAMTISDMTDTDADDIRDTKVAGGGIVLEDSTVANLKFYEDKAYMVAWGITGFCNGDGNGDGVVDGIDFIYIRDSFLKSYPGDYDGTTGPGKYNPAGDYNMDGVVDGIDFIALRNAFLGAPPDNCTTKSWPQ